MSSLTVRNIPEKVLRKLRLAAAEEQRSINAQAIHWFEQGGRQWLSEQERAKLLLEIRSSRRRSGRRHGRGSDSAAIIRSVRDACGQSKS